MSSGRTRSLAGSLVAIALVFPSTAVTQSPTAATPPPLRDAEAVLPAVPALVPIHAEEGVDGQREIWTAGPEFKASFHDGFAFHPRGADGPLAFRWRTVAIDIGGQSLVAKGSAPEPNFTAERCELDHGVVVEAYDVSETGVEQTFTLLEPVNATGDLTVRGRIEGGLTAPPTRSDAQQALQFSAEGHHGVRYGEATAIDAGGRRAAVKTSFDGECVTLRLDGGWLAGASYPVVVDPLTTRRGVSGYSSSWRDVAVGYDRFEDQYMVLATHFDSSPARDHDVYGYLCNRDFTSSRLVYAFTGTDPIRACDVNVVQHLASSGPRRWLALVDRELGGRHYLAIHGRDTRDTTLASAPLTLTSHSRPTYALAKIGGNEGYHSSEMRALVVYHEHCYAPGTVWGFYVDVFSSGLWASSRFAISEGRTYERNGVDVSSAASVYPWVVATPLPSGLGIALTLVHRFTGVEARMSIPQTAPVSHVRLASDTYRRGVVAWVVDGRQINAETISWGGFPLRLNRHPSTNRTLEGRRLHGIAWDQRTESHVALLYEKYHPLRRQVDLLATRLGHGLGVVETQRAQVRNGTGRYWGDMVYNTREGAFAFAHVHRGSALQQIKCGRLVHDSRAGSTAYGSGCGPVTLRAGLPYAGYGGFTVRFDSLPVGITGWMLGSFGSANVTLPSGCTQLIDTTRLMMMEPVGTSPWFGYGRASWPLPDDPVFLGDLYFQLFYVEGGLSRASHGLEVRVRV